jgi:nucleoside 2-deoxyribosyltransferase
MKPRVYLAGAIAGLNYGDATDWRHQAKFLLAERGIETLNPMRAKNVLGERNGGTIGNSYHDYEKLGPFFTSGGIMTRDFNDVKSSDAMLVNLLDLKKPSLGTVMELGWAYALQIPAVVAIEETGNPHDNHPMLHETMRFRVATLEEAIEAVAIVVNR